MISPQEPRNYAAREDGSRGGTRSKPAPKRAVEERTRSTRGKRTRAQKREISFKEWLQGAPKIYAAFSAAVAAAVGFIAPLRILPEPLVEFQFIPSALAVTAFVLTWVWRDQVRKHLKAITVVTVLCLAALIVLNLRYVRPVSYDGTYERTVYYLVGETVIDPDLCGTDYVTIIKQCGGSWNRLHAVYGVTFTAVASGYVFAYGLFVIGLIMTTGGMGFARPRKH